MPTELFLPLLAHVGLALMLVFATAGLRLRAIASGAVRPRDIVLGQRAWPASVQKVSNAFQNQLELPILFYLAVIVAALAGLSGGVLIGLMWAWVGLRYVHAAIHVTTNHLLMRFLAFGASTLVLVLIWIVVAMQVLS